jgi:hypothetical protein
VSTGDIHTDNISHYLYYSREFEVEASKFLDLGNEEMAEECKEHAAEAFKWAWALMTEMAP